jgi:hypothetical protein
MPELARFDGIVIYMNLGDHAPPHFHVRYAGDDTSVQISPIVMTVGALPASVWRKVEDWARVREDELLAAWRRYGGAEDRS